MKLSCFIDIDNCGGDKEDRNVDPVGRSSDDPVIGVENDGNQDKSQEDPLELHAPKTREAPEEKALKDSIENHWPKEQLHMLKGRFIHARKRRDPCSLAEPFIQKM